MPIMPVAPVMPGMPGMPNMPQLGGLPGMTGGVGNPLALMPNLGAPATQMTQVNQATRPARRLYVGGIPSPCYDFMLTTFLNQALMALGICQNAGKAPIIACQVTPERNFAFIEFSDTADATAALQLDGIPFRGNTLKIKRPKDYVAAFGAPPDPMPLGPTIMAQLLTAGAGAGAAPAAPVGTVQLPPGGLPMPGAGIPGAAGLPGAGLPGM